MLAELLTEKLTSLCADEQSGLSEHLTSAGGLTVYPAVYDLLGPSGFGMVPMSEESVYFAAQIGVFDADVTVGQLKGLDKNNCALLVDLDRTSGEYADIMDPLPQISTDDVIRYYSLE